VRLTHPATLRRTPCPLASPIPDPPGRRPRIRTRTPGALLLDASPHKETDVAPTDLQSLPPVLDVPAAAALLGISRTTAYELVRTGKWPTPVLRLGRLIRVPSAALIQLLDGQAPL